MKQQTLAELRAKALEIVARTASQVRADFPYATARSRAVEARPELGTVLSDNALDPDGGLGIQFDDNLKANGVLRLIPVPGHPLGPAEYSGTVTFKDGEVVEAVLPPGSCRDRLLLERLPRSR